MTDPGNSMALVAWLSRLALLALVAAACSSGAEVSEPADPDQEATAESETGEEVEDDIEPEEDIEPEVEDVEAEAGAEVESEAGDEVGDEVEDDEAEAGAGEAGDGEADSEELFPGGGVDLSLVRDDVDCTEEGLGEDAESDFTVAHYVVDGSLGQVCFGESDPGLVSAWETLATITPPGQLLDLGLFGGFASGEDGDEVTLAFVNPIDDAGQLFQMSVNLDAAVDDPDEAMLTMAHEFSHVFTATSVQLDRFADPETCATYDNGEGCYLPTALMYEWIELFWGGGLIDQVDPLEEATGEAGDDRCDLNPGFFGPYAASNPEEDFAESFSAYVFQLPVDTPELQAKMDWFADQPGLVPFRERAEAAGLGPLDNNFESCG